MAFRCYHCHSVKSIDVNGLVEHAVEAHPDKDFSLLKPIVQDGKSKYQSMHYHIKPFQYKYPKVLNPTAIVQSEKGKE